MSFSTVSKEQKAQIVHRVSDSLQCEDSDFDRLADIMDDAGMLQDRGLLSVAFSKVKPEQVFKKYLGTSAPAFFRYPLPTTAVPKTVSDGVKSAYAKMCMVRPPWESASEAVRVDYFKALIDEILLLTKGYLKLRPEEWLSTAQHTARVEIVLKILDIMVTSLVEAKKDDVLKALAQCFLELKAANTRHRRWGITDAVYGLVTTMQSTYLVCYDPAQGFGEQKVPFAVSNPIVLTAEGNGLEELTRLLFDWVLRGFCTYMNYVLQLYLRATTPQSNPVTSPVLASHSQQPPLKKVKVPGEYKGQEKSIDVLDSLKATASFSSLLDGFALLGAKTVQEADAGLQKFDRWVTELPSFAWFGYYRQTVEAQRAFS